MFIEKQNAEMKQCFHQIDGVCCNNTRKRKMGWYNARRNRHLYHPIHNYAISGAIRGVSHCSATSYNFFFHSAIDFSFMRG